MIVHAPEDVAPAFSSTGLFVRVAVKLFARTGVWPSWFVAVVGSPVPKHFVTRALDERSALEHEVGVTLPVPLPASVPVSLASRGAS